MATVSPADSTPYHSTTVRSTKSLGSLLSWKWEQQGPLTCVSNGTGSSFVRVGGSSATSDAGSDGSATATRLAQGRSSLALAWGELWQENVGLGTTSAGLAEDRYSVIRPQRTTIPAWVADTKLTCHSKQHHSHSLPVLQGLLQH